MLYKMTVALEYLNFALDARSWYCSDSFMLLLGLSLICIPDRFFISLLYAVYLVHMKTSRFLFTKFDSVANFDTLLSYLWILFLDPFQTTLMMPNFNSFLEAVYPIGMTTNWSCFTRTIGHNLGNLNWICTKVSAKICFNVCTLCTNFQPDPSMNSCFYSNFSKIKEKNCKWRDLNKNLGAHISGVICFRFSA